MAKKKVYAVKKGIVTGIFYNWDDCKASVDGYPGAEYKGFATEEEAKAYLGIEIGEKPAEDEHHMAVENGQVIVYVDGSYSHDIGTYSYGCIILTPEGKVTRLSGNGNSPECLSIRNVAGEMLGAMNAVKWAIKEGYSHIEIRYDYEGIQKWVTGEWKAKMDLTQKYAEYMRRQTQKIQITFTKVEAHTGDYYNEQADALAKEALTKEEEIV